MRLRCQIQFPENQFWFLHTTSVSPSNFCVGTLVPHTRHLCPNHFVETKFHYLHKASVPDKVKKIDFWREIGTPILRWWCLEAISDSTWNLISAIVCLIDWFLWLGSLLPFANLGHSISKTSTIGDGRSKQRESRPLQEEKPYAKPTSN